MSTIEDFGGSVQFNGDSLYLILCGTGSRHTSSPVSCSLGGRTIAAVFAGPQSWYAGLDQINLPLDAALAGAGHVVLVCSARQSNAVTLVFP